MRGPCILLPSDDFSQTLISLFIDSTVSQIFALISHLPLLEDLVLAGTMLDEGDDHAIFQPSTSPPLTGTLVLSLSSGIEQVVPQLLSLLNGIRLRELKYTFHSKQDLRQMMALVEECSNILEHVDIDDETHGKLWTFNFPYGTSP